MHYELKTIEEAAGKRYLLLNGRGEIFSISELLYAILDCFSQTPDYTAVANQLNQSRPAPDLTPLFIESSITETLARIAPKDEITRSYIRGRMTVVKEGRLHRLYSFTGLLFHKAVFTFLLSAATAVTLWFLYSHGLLSYRQLYLSSFGTLSLSDAPFLYALFIGIILLHELGHASAAWRFGIRPKEIGFGFYFIFPVFYTNVTDIWLLPARRRLVVNIAGIYFQLLVNVLLIAVYPLSALRSLALPLLIANTVSLTVSLIPFFRYDGYWLYSDFFDIPNLHRRSREWMLSLLFFKPSKGKISLILYTLLNLVFWSYVYIEVIEFVATGGAALGRAWREDKITPHHLLDAGILLVTVYLFGVQLADTAKNIYYGKDRIRRSKRTVAA